MAKCDTCGMEHDELCAKLEEIADQIRDIIGDDGIL